MTGRRSFSPAVCHLSFAILFACLTLVLTYPLPLRMTTHLAGDDYDVWGRPWVTWWTKKALCEGHRLYYTNWLFYPHGISVVYHTFSHPNTAIALLLEPLTGPIAAHNVTILLAYALSGFSAYLLAGYLTGDAGPGLVAGLIFAFSTYHVDQSSHPIILSTQWIPLWVLYVLRLFREKHLLRHALLAALFLSLTALSGWHLLTFSLMWLVFYLAYLLLWERGRLRWSALGALVLMGIVTLVLVGPLLLPLVTARLSSGGAEWVRMPSHGENAIDVLAFLVPSYRHPLLGSLHHGIGLRQVFVGYTALALASLGLVKVRRRACFWALSTTAFFTMSLGAYVRFNGTTSARPLQPWLLPLARFIRDPTRLTVMTTLGLAVLAALGTAWLLRRVGRRARAWAVVVLAVLLLFEFLPWPFPTTRIDVPPFYEQLRQEADVFALADLPVRQLELRRLAMFYQTVHQKPIIEGIVGRTPPDAYTFVDQHPILSAFADGHETPGDDVSRQLAALADEGVRYLVLHLRFMTARQVGRWEQYLPYAPFYRDDQIVVYRTRPVPGEDLQVHLPLSGTMGLIYARPDTRYPRVGEPLALQAAWVATGDPSRSYRAGWDLIGPDGRTAVGVAGELVAGWPTGAWQAGDFGLGRYELSTDLAPGPYRLRVRLMDGQREVAARDVGSLLLLPAEGDLPLPADAPPVATFGGRIALVELRIMPGDGMLHLQFTWQALADVGRDYKLFVHLVDGAGALVVQVDTMPRDWTAPTAAWRAGDVVGDLVSLDTYGLPPGVYTLSLGLYDAATQERLELCLPDGASVPDAALRREVALP